MAWTQPLSLTLQLMTFAVILATVVGVPLAFFISMSRRSGKTWVFVTGYCLTSLVACIATPLILHAAAWESTAGKFGWMTFSQTAARTYTGLAGSFSGIIASAWIHGLYGAALTALSTWFGTSRIADEVIDQARIDGGPIWVWWKIRLPIALPWVATGLLATAILAATEMTVVNLYGIRTLADEFYMFRVAQPSIASVLMVLVLPAILLIALLIVAIGSTRGRVDARLIDFHRRPPLRTANESSSPTRAQFASACFAVALATLLYAFPLGGLVLKTGQQVSVVEPIDGGESTVVVDWSMTRSAKRLFSGLNEFAAEYQWTLLIAIGVAFVSVPTAMLLASRARSDRRFQITCDLLSLTCFLIPGPIVGVAVIRLFTLPVPTFHMLYHETLIPTMVALLVRAIPISYWVLRAGYSGLDDSILDTARMEMSSLRRLWAVERRLLKGAIFVAAIGSAVMASGDVPAMLLVIPPGVVTVGTRLFMLLHSGARTQEACLAFWYVMTIVLVSLFLRANWNQAAR